MILPLLISTKYSSHILFIMTESKITFENSLNQFNFLGDIVPLNKRFYELYNKLKWCSYMTTLMCDCKLETKGHLVVFCPLAVCWNCGDLGHWDLVCNKSYGTSVINSVKKMGSNSTNVVSEDKTFTGYKNNKFITIKVNRKIYNLVINESGAKFTRYYINSSLKKCQCDDSTYKHSKCYCPSLKCILCNNYGHSHLFCEDN